MARNHGKWFTLFVTVAASGLMLATCSLGDSASMVPRWVLAVILPLLLVQMFVDWAPGSAQRLRMKHDLFATETYRRQTPGEISQALTVDPRAACLAVGWILTFPLLLSLLGIAAAISVHAALYLLLRARGSPMLALAVVVVLYGFATGALRLLN